MKKVIKNNNNLRLNSGQNLKRSTYYIDPNINYFEDGGKIDEFFRSGKFGDVLSSAGTIINAGINNAKIGSDSNIKQSINTFAATPVERSSREALSNQWVNSVPLNASHRASEFTASSGEQFGNTLGATISGASTGAKIGGPWGAVIGGVIGLGSGIIGSISGNNKARRQARRLNKLATEANEARQKNYYASADFLDEQDMFNYLSNYKCMGGPLNNIFERGGYLGHTHGGIFGNDVIYINEGDTHENNPYGGVQSGVDDEGTPNLVEEGEVIYNDYVFSNRLYPTEEQLEQYGLPKQYNNWTFAKIANELSKESEERSNDPISLNGLRDSMSKLRSLQEALRTEGQDSNIFDNGGDKDNNSQNKLLAEAEEYADKHSGARRNTPRWNQVRDQRLQKLNYKRQVETAKADAIQLMKDNRRAAYDFLVDQGYILPPYTEDFNISGLDKYSPQDIKNYNDIASGKLKYDRILGPDIPDDNNAKSDVVMDFQDGPNDKPKDEVKQNNPNGTLAPKKNKSGNQSATPENSATKDGKEQNDDTPKLTGKELRDYYNFNPQHGDIGVTLVHPNKNLDPNLSYTTQGLIDNRRVYPQPSPDEGNNEKPEDNQVFDTISRYAPILGNLAAYLGNSKDYSDVDAYMEQTANPRSVAFTPLGNYIRPEYVSPWELTNPIEREAASTRRYLINNAGNNRAAANAALVASDYNTLGLLGQALLQGKQYNQQQRLAAEEFNRGTDQFNSQGSLQAQGANMGLNNYYLNRALNNYNFRFGIDTMYDQARSQNITSLFNNLGNIGRENYIMNQINSNRGLYYNTDRSGRSSYKYD